MQVLCLYGPRKSKPRLKSELSKQQYTMTRFDCNHLTHVIVLFGKCKNLCVTVQFLLCFILDLRAISEYRPPGMDLEARFIGFLRDQFRGLIFGGEWRGYFRDFTVYFNLMKKWMNCCLQWTEQCYGCLVNLVLNQCRLRVLIRYAIWEITCEWHESQLRVKQTRLSSIVSNVPIAIRFSRRQLCSSVPPFVFAMLFIPFHILSRWVDYHAKGVSVIDQARGQDGRILAANIQPKSWSNKLGQIKNLLYGQKENFFLRDQRGKSRAGPILPGRGFSHIISSLHDKCFMSQARRTRHFARSARPAQNAPFISLGS